MLVTTMQSKPHLFLCVSCVQCMWKKGARSHDWLPTSFDSPLDSSQTNFSTFSKIISKFIYSMWNPQVHLKNKDGAIFQNIFCYCWAGQTLDGHQRISVDTLGISGWSQSYSLWASSIQSFFTLEDMFQFVREVLLFLPFDLPRLPHAFKNI